MRFSLSDFYQIFNSIFFIKNKNHIVPDVCGKTKPVISDVWIYDESTINILYLHSRINTLRRTRYFTEIEMKLAHKIKTIDLISICESLKSQSSLLITVVGRTTEKSRFASFQHARRSSSTTKHKHWRGCWRKHITERRPLQWNYYVITTTAHDAQNTYFPKRSYINPGRLVNNPQNRCTHFGWFQYIFFGISFAINWSVYMGFVIFFCRKPCEAIEQ